MSYLQEKDSIFSSEKLIERLKNGINPMPERLIMFEMSKGFLYKDRINGEQYQYIPSLKNVHGEPLGYSFECLTTTDGIRYVAECNGHQSKDKYSINGQKVTRDEFFEKRLKAFKKGDNELKDNAKLSNSIIQGKNMTELRQLIVFLKMKTKANKKRNNAISEYKQSKDMPHQWSNKAIEQAVESYKISQLIDEQSNIELQRIALMRYFSNLENESPMFIERLYDLIGTGYFTNLEQTEHEDIVQYLTMVFSDKGINDCIEFLLKMKDAYIEYSKKPLIKKESDLIRVAAGLSYFSYKSQGEYILLDLNNIKIKIWNQLNDSEMQEVKWHEFSHVLLQPLNGIIEETKIENLVENYTSELLRKTIDSKKKRR